MATAYKIWKQNMIEKDDMDSFGYYGKHKTALVGYCAKIHFVCYCQLRKR
jgi:hypothetical protein